MRKFRIETGMSQTEFSKHFGIPLRTLQDWEQGRRNPPSYVLELIKKVWELEKLNM